MTPRRVAIVTTHLVGFEPSGGVGAATTSLAIALARSGHQVDVLYLKDRVPHPLDPEWGQRYEDSGVRVRRIAQPAVAVEPDAFRRLRAVELELREDTPDVVIAHEYGAPAYIAQRLRQLGLAFEKTLFVVYCHGTAPWVKEVTGNPRISPEMLAHARLEQAGVELADVVVSPSAYLVGWMRERGWHVPEARVIPLITRAAALGEPPVRERGANGAGRVERLAYFGRLEERKGIAPFVAALNTLPPELVEGVELEFVGGRSGQWDPDRVRAQLSERTLRAFGDVSFATDLGRDEALARLDRPGTLAVMPSLAENSPNVVYECLEARIPFLASTAGGIGELVAAEDRERVLFQPTVDGIAAALRRALGDGAALRPARPAFAGSEVVAAWLDVVATDARRAAHPHTQPLVDVVVHDPRVLAAQTYEHVHVVASPDDGSAEWLIVLGEGDVPRPEFIEVLVRSQAASGADVVTCGVLQDGYERYFLGDPGGVALLENGYGTAALLRRALLPAGASALPLWPLLAQLSAAGARIVSVPVPLLASERRPATLESAPGEALRVVEALEGALPDGARLLARLAAGLAAEQPPAPPRRGRLRRLRSLGRG